MADPLNYFRRLCATPADAVRWACVLEATAPKAGNVYPGHEFNDLKYSHFITAAEIAADIFADSSRSYPQRILDCIDRTRETSATNVNLGILLLLGPLVATDETAMPQSVDQWNAGIPEQLVLDANSSRLIFQAMHQASAGGLGKVDEMDVNDTDAHSDIIGAMRLAKDRDRIALQYAEGFADLTGSILPVVYDAIVDSCDILGGIRTAHLRLLAASPDSLIARKCGIEVARQVQQDASRVDPTEIDSCLQFDRSLHRDDHRQNPGTTADLIAAALYILLRTPPSDLT